MKCFWDGKLFNFVQQPYSMLNLLQYSACFRFFPRYEVCPPIFLFCLKMYVLFYALGRLIEIKEILKFVSILKTF